MAVDQWSSMVSAGTSPPVRRPQRCAAAWCWLIYREYADFDTGEEEPDDDKADAREESISTAFQEAVRTEALAKACRLK